MDKPDVVQTLKGYRIRIETGGIALESEAPTETEALRLLWSALDGFKKRETGHESEN